MKLVEIRSSRFPNVLLHLDGQDVSRHTADGGGAARCQYGVGPRATFKRIDNADGTVSFESYAFQNVFLRMDGRGVTHWTGAGGGHVNAQYMAGSYETFKLERNDDGTQSITSTEFSNVHLRMDGAGVTRSEPCGAGVVNCQYDIGTYEKLSICDCLTHVQVNDAISQFARWFPEEAAKIEAHRGQIVGACCPPYTTSAEVEAALRAIPYAPLPAAREHAVVELGPCGTAIAWVVVDSVLLGYSLIGLIGLSREPLHSAVVPKIGSLLDRLKKSCKDFFEKKTTLEKVFVVLDVLMQAWSAIGQAVWQVLRDLVGSWWDWIKIGVTAAAQFTAWFTSGGVAFAAECVLVFLGAEQVIEDFVEVGRACNASV